MTGLPAGDGESGLKRFERYVLTTGIVVETIDSGAHTLTIAQAAEALGVPVSSILKTLLFHDGDGHFVIAIASGIGRIDAQLLAAHRSLPKVKLARPDIVMHTLGYPAGGVPPVDLPADIPVIVDPLAAQLETSYAGAGTIRHLARFLTADILRLNNASIAPITSSRD